MPPPTSEASRYQQLRGHLAYLKLATAAEARRLERRIRFSNLPTPATIEDFDFEAQPGVDPDLIRDLASNRYLETGTNILIIGPPGVGKTMLAIGLARKVAEAGHRTYSPTPLTLLPAATGPRSRAGGRPRCGSSLDQRAW